MTTATQPAPADTIHQAAATTKARLIVLDLETIPTQDAAIAERIRNEAIEKRPASNTLKELKLAWDTEKAREERAREALLKTAVDPLLAMPICNAMLLRGMDGQRYCHTLDLARLHAWEGRDADECDPILDFTCYEAGLAHLAKTLTVASGPETIWVGHNIAGFDLPVLLNRWRRAGIRPPEHFPRYCNGRWQGRVYDTMLRTPSKNGLGLISLSDAAEAYGLGPAKTVLFRGEPMDGSRVYEAFEAGEMDTILEYNMADVLIEEALYMVQTANDTWGTWDLRDEVAEQIAEVEASSLSEGARALAIVRILDQAGLIPRMP